MPSRPPIHDDNPDPAGRGDRRAIRRAPATGEVVPHASQPGPYDDEDDGPSEEDRERFGGVTRTCPECGHEVYDDTAVCYHCGHAFAAARKGTPLWIILTITLVLVAFGLSLVLGLF